MDRRESKRSILKRKEGCWKKRGRRRACHFVNGFSVGNIMSQRLVRRTNGKAPGRCSGGSLHRPSYVTTSFSISYACACAWLQPWEAALHGGVCEAPSPQGQGRLGRQTMSRPTGWSRAIHAHPSSSSDLHKKGCGDAARRRTLPTRAHTAMPARRQWVAAGG